MFKALIFVAMLLLSACGGQERPVADSSIIPPFPPPAVNMARPVTNYPMLPEIQCLQETGSPTSLQCPLIGSSAAPSKPTSTAPRS